jgi:hypothetical protein
MALFQHNSRSIPYHIDFGPFAFDLVLLQSSKFSEDFWRPIKEMLNESEPAGGRVLVCDWFDSSGPRSRWADDLGKLISTLGLASVRIVAMDDAVDVAAEAERLYPGVFDRTLFFPAGGPKGEDLKRAVREFCELS